MKDANTKPYTMETFENYGNLAKHRFSFITKFMAVFWPFLTTKTFENLSQKLSIVKNGFSDVNTLERSFKGYKNIPDRQI